MGCYFLSRRIPAVFWEAWHSRINASGHTEQGKVVMSRYCYENGLARPHNAIQWLSWHGAIRVKANSSLPPAYYCQETHLHYADPTNKVHGHFFRLAWGHTVFANANDVTIGNLIEAFLGYMWFMKVFYPRRAENHSSLQQAVGAIEIVIENIYDMYAVY